MTRYLGLGVLTAVAVLGCAAKDDMNGGGASNTMLPGTGGAPGVGTPGTGGAPAGGLTTTGTGGGGVVTGGTGGSGVVAGGTGGHSATSGTGGTGTMGTGTGGTGSAGAGGGTGGTDMTTPPPADYHPPCLTKGGDLVLMGDSYVNYIESLEPRLTAHATSDGILTAPDRFDDHAVAGTSLAAGITATIPNQWFDEAKALKPKFIVMDGGGNDILLYNMQCLDDGVGNDKDPGCQQVVMDATAVAKKIMDDMITTSVKQILYYFYPDVPAGGHDITAWAFPMAKAQCEERSNADFECTMVDLRPTFQGHPDWFMLDNIHPTADGMDAMGELIWGVMKDHCMAQTPAQNCGCVSE